MAESKYEQMVAAIKSAIEAIRSDQGTTYWYTPAHVIEYPALSKECLNTAEDSVYVISPGMSEVDAGTMTTDMATATFDLSLCRKFAVDSENPFNPPSEHRRLVQSRMIQDVTTALNVLRRTNSTVINWIRATSENRTAEDTVVSESWAIAFLQIEVDFFYTDSTP